MTISAPEDPDDRGHGVGISQLPPELILQILDIAAASSTATALALCRVSSWAKSTAQPRLLHAVALSTDRQLHAFERAILTARYGAPQLAMVRYLWLHADMYYLDLPAHFPHLLELALTPMHLLQAALEAPVPAPRVTLLPLPPLHAARPLAELCSLARTDPAVLARVTHLSCALLDTMALPLLPAFPHLTHLAVSGEYPRAELEELCVGARSLRALILVLYTDVDRGFLAALRERFPNVYVLEGEGHATVEGWLEKARAGDGFWDRAVRLCDEMET
ncbi:hypothetical protein PLICRDRAFT_47293 [Plicaturopsis crispa FD-325 SS-3]|uniref:F-box domain-containing protein n=1 Tax=Plicaturopsis crispa FD-325 SS-3 TaxID=944288 RepID=A0A0C9T2A9_PLICR|nr:hypothetical protein PLICRDRAFT_47293 [Plicaturopsis crispa FD-325 SS-3]